MKKKIKQEPEMPWLAREIEKCIDLTLNYTLNGLQKNAINSYFHSLKEILENE